MKNREYWRLRFVQLEAAQHKISASTAEEIKQQYEETKKQIEGKISLWYQRFAKNNDISMADARKWLMGNGLKEFKWGVKEYIKYGEENNLTGRWAKELENVSAKFHISRLEALKINTQQCIEALFLKQHNKITEAVNETFKSSYYHTAYELQKGFGIGFDVGRVDENYLSKVLAKPWAVDGYNFSDRIWKNKDKLIQEIHTELSRNIVTGGDPQNAIDAVAKKLDVSKNNVGALVMTEESYFNSTAKKDCFNDLGVEEYEIVATLDSRTSEICQSLDGKVFPMKDYEPGVTANPFHVRCRTTTAPHFSESFGQIGGRAAKVVDGRTYYVPADMTYAEWKKAYVK